MIAGLQAFAGGIAAVSTMNAIVSWYADMLTDCRWWSVAALVFLGVLVAARHVADEQRRREARRSAVEREQWFASFERRRRMRES